MKELTSKQERVLEMIMRSWIIRGKPPTDEEIADRLTDYDLTAHAVKYHVVNLMKHGYLSRDGHRYVLCDVSGERVQMQCRFVPKRKKGIDNPVG